MKEKCGQRRLGGFLALFNDSSDWLVRLRCRASVGELDCSLEGFPDTFDPLAAEVAWTAAFGGGVFLGCGDGAAGGSRGMLFALGGSAFVSFFDGVRASGVRAGVSDFDRLLVVVVAAVGLGAGGAEGRFAAAALAVVGVTFAFGDGAVVTTGVDFRRSATLLASTELG
eukprot:c8693_g1_i1.p1 GENE.c8693_g1_i1~~c8693_g1_i1.p1  ORF type:complete len:169 (+),score=29.84 c8693_g1_i1:163-669(+)